MSSAFSWSSNTSSSEQRAQSAISREANYSPNESARSSVTNQTIRTEELSKPRNRVDPPSPVPPIGTYNVSSTLFM